MDKDYSRVVMNAQVSGTKRVTKCHSGSGYRLSQLRSPANNGDQAAPCSARADTCSTSFRASSTARSRESASTYSGSANYASKVSSPGPTPSLASTTIETSSAHSAAAVLAPWSAAAAADSALSRSRCDDQQILSAASHMCAGDTGVGSFTMVAMLPKRPFAMGAT